MIDTVANPMSDVAISALNGLPPKAVSTQLDRILRSRVFVHSHRIRRFLQFIVEQCLTAQQMNLKEYLIGLEVFNRHESFDPRVDSIVRVEARRLRAKLEEYYQTEGRDDQLRIELRKGSYIPIFDYHRPGYAAYAAVAHRRNCVAIARFSTANGEATELVDDITRRLAHILIHEGHCQVLFGQVQDHGAAQPDFVLDGLVEQNGESVNLLLQLRNVKEGAYVWSATGNAEGLDGLARSLNRAVVTSHANTLTFRLQRHRSRGLDLYLQGRYLWKHGSPESIRDSVELFTKAVERDAEYAAAWAALAEALLVSAIFGFQSTAEASPRILEAAHKACELNDVLPEAHVAVGAVASLLDHNWDIGEKHFQHAIQTDGHDLLAHLVYGLQLACRGISNAARMEVERALELDPVSLTANFVLAWLSGVENRYDEAVAHHTLVSQLAPDYPLTYLGLGWAHCGAGRYADAIACFTDASRLLKSKGLLAGCIGFCDARMGQPDDARRRLAFLSSQLPAQGTTSVSMAAIHSGLGEMDRAFACLDAAADARELSLPLQLLNPEFEPLRSDPRFAMLLDRMKLTPFQSLLG